MTDKQLIKQEIERIIEEETPISKGSDYYHGAKESMEKLLQFINSLPEDFGCEVNCTTKSEDLEEYAKKLAKGAALDKHNLIWMCKKGAEWQRKKAMQDFLEKAKEFFIEKHIGMFTQFKNYMQNESEN